MLTKKQLKENILRKNICFDNEFLDKYIDIVYKAINCTKKRKSSKTYHKHHFIPVYFYYTIADERKRYSRNDYENIAEQDPDNIVITISRYDHIKLHCYLVLCSKSKWMLRSNIESINLLNKNSRKNYKYLRSISDVNNFIKKKRFESADRRIWMHNNETNKKVNKQEIPEYLNQGYHLGKNNTKTKRIWWVINNDNTHKNKCVTEDRLKHYLSNGWSFGKK